MRRIDWILELRMKKNAIYNKKKKKIIIKIIIIIIKKGI